MTPICPICGAPSKLTDVHEIPQTIDQFHRGVDSYVCKDGHVFEAVIPVVVSKEGLGVRGDM